MSKLSTAYLMVNQRWREASVGVILVVLCLTVWAACDASGPQRDFAKQAFEQKPSGYTHTFARGRIDSSHIDEDDWRIAPDYQLGNVEAAHPNPSSGSDINILVNTGGTQRGNTLVLCYGFEGRSNELRYLTSRSAQNAPFFDFRVSPAQFPGNVDLVRLFVMDTNGSRCDGSGRLVTYGDVRLK